MIEGASLLALPVGRCIECIEKTESDLLVSVVSTSPTSCCPLCAWPSSAVHSYYHRRVGEVPCGGQSVRLALTVRKCFCRHAGCRRKIFAERLPPLVEPWAQRTVRLREQVQAIGLSTSASQGTRLSARLGICTSWMTMLRRSMHLPPVAAGSVAA
jgi:transposase